MHFRVVDGQVTYGTFFYILDEADNTVPFYVFASDGISYKKAYKKEMIVFGPGQREGLLLQFEEAGKYRIMKGDVLDYQDWNDVDVPAPVHRVGAIGPQKGNQSASRDLPIAFINVKKGNMKAVDLDALKFTPGIKHSIVPAEISHQLSVNFIAGTVKNTLPLLQFNVDGQEFDVHKTQRRVPASSSAEWTLTSNMNFWHPFHIHVNPFQVKVVAMADLLEHQGGDALKRATLSASLEPEDMWRDTVFMPPFSVIKIWQKFGGEKAAWQGKTIFHCHFFNHEDMGLMSGFIIDGPETPSVDASADFVV